MIGYLSSLLVPVLFFAVLCWGVLKKLPVFDLFSQGARKGAETVFQIFPTLTGLLMGVGALRTSGLLEWLTERLGSLAAALGMPEAVLPIVFVKLFSSSAALAMAAEIYASLGADSLEGFLVSLILSSTESVFYCMSVYYTSVGIAKTRWTLPGALFAALVGVMVSLLLCLS